jgi:hypothetical protein
MLCRVPLARTDVNVSEESSASIIRVTRISELGTMLAVILVFLYSVPLLLVSANVVPNTDSCHPDDGGATFIRNVGSYTSHTA